MPSVVSQAGSALRRVIGALQHHPIRMHLVAVGIFVLLALTVTWPLVPQIHQGIAAIGYDGLHNLWLLGHTRAAILAHQPLFAAPLLYYPDGSSLLTHGLGPVMGLLRIPLALPAGESTLTLELAAGSFQPSAADPRDLSFAVRTIDLETQP